MTQSGAAWRRSVPGCPPRMSEFRLSPEAETELDAISIRIARDSGSVDLATRVVEDIMERFWLLARYPYIGRRRDHDLGPGLRSSRRTTTSSSTASKKTR